MSRDKRYQRLLNDKRWWRGVSDKVAKDKAEIYILSPLIRGGYKAGII